MGSSLYFQVIKSMYFCRKSGKEKIPMSVMVKLLISQLSITWHHLKCRRFLEKDLHSENWLHKTSILAWMTKSFGISISSDITRYPTYISRISYQQLVWSSCSNTLTSITCSYLSRQIYRALLIMLNGSS